MAAVDYFRTHPELSALADLYHNKLWHQLTQKIEQLFKDKNFQARDSLIQFCRNLTTDFETKINLLKLAHFAVIVSQQNEKIEAVISYLEGVVEKLSATREAHIEEPILYIKMQIALFKLDQGKPKECKKLFDYCSR